jgi:hypothetical protein
VSISGIVVCGLRAWLMIGLVVGGKGWSWNWNVFRAGLIGDEYTWGSVGGIVGGEINLVCSGRNLVIDSGIVFDVRDFG